MRKIILLLILLTIAAPIVSWAGPFDAWDNEAQRAAVFVKDILGGEGFDAILKEDYPGSEISWGGRISTTDEFGGAIYIIYCEIKQPGKEPLYYYYEVAFSPVNEQPELRKKYNIN